MPRSPHTRWIAALTALLVFLLAAWLFGSAIGSLSEGERTVLRVGLVVLGLVLAAALLWWLRPAAGLDQLTSGKASADEALAALGAARARLGRGGLDARPVVLVIGAAGSCKTTVVTRAGLDPALLAGDAPALGPGETAPPTAAANVWLAGGAAGTGASATGGAVLAEPSGAVFADAGRWRAFVRALRAPGLAAALGRGAPAPRAAVLCVSCDAFFAGSEQMDRLAQMTRERLAEAARTLGVALPVYVVFTKADRVPQFEAWVAPFTRDEVRAPLGAALPFDAPRDAAATAGGYAERTVPWLEHAFAAVTGALAGRRLDLLGRESVAERRLSAYEFPRELGKLAPAATRFLAEVCRPLQLGVSPQLRGFYFVGARPVVLEDALAGQGVAASAPAAAPALAAGATNAFIRPGGAVPNAPLAVGGYAPPAQRRVPQWAFLDRLFPDVVLADRGAVAAALGGVRVARLRRGLLGAAAAAGLVLAVMVGRSWANNRALADRTSAAAAGVAALPVVTSPAGTIALPSADALRRLDALRTVLDTIRGYQRGGVPTRLAMGLWQGDALADGARRVWLAGYKRQLYDPAWTALVDTLRALPDAPLPADDYAHTYGELKAYLINTAEPRRSTPDFLAPVLLASWRRGQPLDADVAALARRQFEFYARELAAAPPFPEAADSRLVTHTRDFLGRFAGAERIYQYMLAEANKAAPAAQLAALAPQAPGVLTAPGDVPGAFTAGGWTFMQGAFRNADRFFQGERWVVGDAGAAQAGDRDRVLAELRARYRADYVGRWRTWVRGLGVVRPANARDAAQKLGTLGGAQSPLLAALSLASRNTVVDSGVTAAFQPVHVVAAPQSLDKFVSKDNEPYVGGLLALQGAVEQVGNMPPATDTAGAMLVAQAGNQALMQAAQAKVAARQLAQKFAVDTAAAPVGPALAELLVAPVTGAEGVLRGVAATRPPPGKKVAAAGSGGAPPPPPKADPASIAQLNDRGKALCASLTPVLAKFPFNPEAKDEATVAEVNAIFAPGSGTLWALQQEKLEGVLEKQGDKWAPAAGSPIALSGPFVAFFNRAARVSDALYGGAADPRVVFTAQALGRQATLAQGTQAARLGKNAAPAQFAWPSAAGRDARLEVDYNKLVVLGKKATVARGAGEWAMFRLMAQAAKWDGAAGSYKAEWTGGGQGPVALQVTFPSGLPVMQRGWLGQMACAPQVTK